MTENPTPGVDRRLPLHEQAAILSEDHNRGLQRTRATVREIIEVSPQLARVIARIDGLAADPEWLRPNVSVRIHLTDGDEQLSRVYTVRTADPDREMVEIDVVRHGESSPMMRWLDGLRVDDGFLLVGPRPHFPFPEANGRSLAVFADATAIPALYSLLLQAPSGLHGHGWVATSDLVAYGELPEVPGLRLEHVDPGQGFASQFAAYGPGAEVVVWGAGERDEMRGVRSHFRNEVGLSKGDVAVYGYWRKGTSNTAIDEARLRAYEAVLRRGGTIAELDDLALPI